MKTQCSSSVHSPASPFPQLTLFPSLANHEAPDLGPGQAVFQGLRLGLISKAKPASLTLLCFICLSVHPCPHPSTVYASIRPSSTHQLLNAYCVFNFLYCLSPNHNKIQSNIQIFVSLSFKITVNGGFMDHSFCSVWPSPLFLGETCIYSGIQSLRGASGNLRIW